MHERLSQPGQHRRGRWCRRRPIQRPSSPYMSSRRRETLSFQGPSWTGRSRILRRGAGGSGTVMTAAYSPCGNRSAAEMLPSGPTVRRVVMTVIGASWGSMERTLALLPSAELESRPSAGRWLRDARLSHRLVGQPAHAVHIHAFEADQPGGAVAARRVQHALVVEMRHAGLERVVADVARLARLAVMRALQALPVGHQGLALGLTVDRPGRAVVVRLAALRAAVDVRQDAEAELWVLVEHLALRHVVAEMRRDEILVPQHVLEQRANLLAPRRTRLGGQDTMTVGGEAVQRVSHEKS